MNGDVMNFAYVMRYRSKDIYVLLCSFKKAVYFVPNIKKIPGEIMNISFTVKTSNSKQLLFFKLYLIETHFLF